MEARKVVALPALAVAVPTGSVHSLALLLKSFGTFETTIEPDDAIPQGSGDRTDLVGDWTVTIREDGRILWRDEAPDDNYGDDMGCAYVVHALEPVA